MILRHAGIERKLIWLEHLNNIKQLNIDEVYSMGSGCPQKKNRPTLVSLSLTHIHTQNMLQVILKTYCKKTHPSFRGSHIGTLYTAPSLSGIKCDQFLH